MITILGASGFIGSHLTRFLQASSIEHRPITRDENPSGHLGRVIDCAGYTGDFISHPLDAVVAHASRVVDVVRNCTFDSYLYLSSTRLYRNHESPIAREDDLLCVSPTDVNDLYTLSKAMGESIVLMNANGRVARLSNVYGPGASGTFLSDILAAARKGSIVLESALDSERDYVSIDAVVPLLVEIAQRGTERIYNVASGQNVTNRELTDAISRLTGCTVTVRENAPVVHFPRIDIARAQREFSFRPSRILDDLPALAT